jgi:hypothetical protein
LVAHQPLPRRTRSSNLKTLLPRHSRQSTASPPTALDSGSVGRAALLGIACALLLVLTGCGGSSMYSLAKTRTCLTERGAKTGGRLDFVASTATGGAFVTSLGDNSVEVVFGETKDDAQQIEQAYQRFAFKNVKAGLADVLRRYNNAVTLWRQHPQDSDLALVVGCLK